MSAFVASFNRYPRDPTTGGPSPQPTPVARDSTLDGRADATTAPRQPNSGSGQPRQNCDRNARYADNTDSVRTPVGV